MKNTKQYPRFNIIVTPDGLERVTFENVAGYTLDALKFYMSIAKDVERLDKKIRKIKRKEK